MCGGFQPHCRLGSRPPSVVISTAGNSNRPDRSRLNDFTVSTTSSRKDMFP